MTTSVKFKAGQLLIKEGEGGGGLYIIRRGRVKVFRERANSEVVLAALGPGDVLGTMTVVTGEPRTASVRALEDGEAVIMDAAAFAEEIQQLPKWITVVIKDLTTRIKNVNEMLVDASVRDRRLRMQVSNVFHHLGRFAHFLALMIRHSRHEDDTLGPVTPLQEALVRAEPVLNLRHEYLEKLWAVIVESGLVREVNSRKFGAVMSNVQPRLLEALGDHAFLVAREGITAAEVAPLDNSSDSRGPRAIFERICRTLLEQEIEATAADRAYP